MIMGEVRLEMMEEKECEEEGNVLEVCDGHLVPVILVVR
jgi:hypothetical protein